VFNLRLKKQVNGMS